MQRKTEVMIAVVVILALILVLFFLLRPAPQETPTETVAPTKTQPVAREVPEVNPADVPEAHEVSATTVGRTFVERFGSYSTESGYVNIDDVLPLTTDQLANRLENIADDARSADGGAYYGVSTRIISVKTEEEGDSAVTLLLTTQREESFDTPGNRSVRYQDIRLELVKDGDDWKVADFTWLEE